MSFRKLKSGKIRVEGDYTINGIRYRPSKLIETQLEGLQLKALVTTIEMELLEETKLIANDPKKLSELDIKDACEWYIKTNNLEQNTIDWYRRYINNRTVEFFKNKKVTSITSADAAKFFNKLDKEISKATNKPLSPKTKKHYLTTLHSIFNALEENKIIKENPFANIKIKVPRKLKNDKYYNIDEVKEHIQVLSEYAPLRHFLYYVLTIMCGLRPSEARGLTWNKINWIEQKVLIDESLAFTTKGYITKSTKNNEPRELDLIDLAIKLLRIHYADELEKYKESKIKINIRTNYIFTNPYGNHIGSTTFKNWWLKFCNRHNLRYVCPYGLRHTTATMLAYNNIPLANIAEQMGHLDTTTTLVYIHAVEEGKKEVRNVLNENVNIKYLKVD